MERGHPARVVHDSPCNQSWMIRRTQQPCVLRMLQVGDANLCQAIVAYTNFVAVVHTSHCQSLRLNGNHLLIDGRHIQSSLFTGWRQLDLQNAGGAPRALEMPPVSESYPWPLSLGLYARSNPCSSSRLAASALARALAG